MRKFTVNVAYTSPLAPNLSGNRTCHVIASTADNAATIAEFRTLSRERSAAIARSVYLDGAPVPFVAKRGAMLR
jgi:hypothetical protein